MKEVGIGFICLILGMMIMAVIASYQPEDVDFIEIESEPGGIKIVSEDELIPKYDPNNMIYRYIPPAHESWIKEFGDNERTRLFHTVSELRVIQAALNKRLMYLESLHTDPNDPNGVKE